MITYMNMKMTKREKELIAGIKIGDKEELVVNPFSKVECILPAEAVAIYDVMMGCQVLLEAYYQASLCRKLSSSEVKKAGKMHSQYYAAKDIFIRNWPEFYGPLID